MLDAALAAAGSAQAKIWPHVTTTAAVMAPFVETLDPHDVQAHEAGSCSESALEYSSSADYQDAPLCHWPSELVTSADTLISVHDTGGEAGGAHKSGAQGVTLVQPLRNK